MRLLSFVGLSLGIATLAFAAQPPRTETEDPDPPAKRKDVRVEETGTDLARLAETERSPAIRRLFQKLAVPHETILVTVRPRSLKVRPLPQ
jgi:hypothetical protein